jgi:hypothetical protein
VFHEFYFLSLQNTKELLKFLESFCPKAADITYSGRRAGNKTRRELAKALLSKLL